LEVWIEKVLSIVEEQKGGKRNENTNQDWVVDRFVCLLVEFKGKEQSNIP